MNSFIVELWSRVFSTLRWVSIFQILSFLIRPLKGSYVFVESWVLGNLLLSISLWAGSSATGMHRWELAGVIYAFARVTEVVVYQVNVLLFDEYRAKKAGESYTLRGYRRIVILSLHNYAEIIFWFALVFRNVPWAFGGHQVNTLLGSLNLSFFTMTTFAQTGASPSGVLGEALTLLESAVGIFMALVVLARVISLLPEPKTLDEFEE